MRFADAVTWARAFSSTDTRPLGFSLLAAGALSGVVGVLAVLFAQDAPGMQKYAYREVAGAALGLALPLFLAGAATSLPMRHAAQAAAGSGAMFCLVAVGLFVHHYPYHWNVLGRDSSPMAIVAYGIGLAYLVGAVASGLLDAYVELKARRSARDDGSDEDEVTDEEVMRDLLETTSRQRLTWGGVREGGQEIRITVPEAAAPISGALHRLGQRSTIAAEEFAKDVGTLLVFRGHRDADAEAYDDGNANALAKLRSAKTLARPPWWRRLATWWRR